MKTAKFISRLILFSILACSALAIFGTTQSIAAGSADKFPTISVGIAPYQDMAMLVNIDHLGLEKKYGVDVELITMAWEDLTPALASAGKTVDIAFASLIQFVTQERSLNKNTQDAVRFIYPAYVFKGGAFVSFNKDVPEITEKDIDNKTILTKFLSFKIGAQKSSSYEMMIFTLSKKVGIPFPEVKMYDIGAADGLLAAFNGSIDMSSAGLTQRNEAVQRGGRVVLDMEVMGLVDIAGFIVKESTLNKKKDQIISVIKMWYDCIDYVMSDIDTNSVQSLNYLKEKSSTKYTLEQYKVALSQEYFPRNIAQVKENILGKDAKFNCDRILDSVTTYFLENGIIKERPENTNPIVID